MLNRYYAKKLDNCREAYESGNLGALLDALAWCHEGAQPLPLWLARAAIECALPSLGIANAQSKPKKKPRTGRLARWATQYRQDMIHFTQWDALEDALQHDELPKRWAADAAEIVLRGSPAEATSATIEKNAKLVRRRKKANPWRYMQLRMYPLKMHSPRHIDGKLIDEIRALKKKKGPK